MDHTKILKAHQYFAGPILSMSGCVSVAFLSPPAICRMSHGQSDHKPRHAGRALFICVSYLGSSEDIDGVNPGTIRTNIIPHALDADELGIKVFSGCRRRPSCSTEGGSHG
jgi:hypothetical protein